MDRQPSREVARLAGGLGSGRGSNDEENSTVIVIVGALSSLSSSSLSSISSSSSTFRRVFVEVGVLKVAASQERGSMHEKKCAACSATVRSVACSLRAVSRLHARNYALRPFSRGSSPCQRAGLRQKLRRRRKHCHGHYRDRHCCHWPRRHCHRYLHDHVGLLQSHFIYEYSTIPLDIPN